jgi:hypothetical protein
MRSIRHKFPAQWRQWQLRLFKSLLQTERIPESSVRIIRSDSTKLKPESIISIAGKIRLFSIDGGHEEHHVCSDAELAYQVLTNDGIMVFDDFFNSQYPDVTLAVVHFLEQRKREVTPFLITKNKVYVCRRSRSPDYCNAAKEIPLWAGAQLDQLKFMGGDIVYISQSITNRAIYQFAAGLGFGNSASSLLRARR